MEYSPDRVTVRPVTLRFRGAADGGEAGGVGSPAPSTYLRAGFARTFRQFPKLAIHNLYAGVDAIFYGNGDDLEYDLKIAAGSLSSGYGFRWRARNIRIDEAGNPVSIETAAGALQQRRPRVFPG